MQCLCNMRRLHFRGEIRLFDSALSRTAVLPKKEILKNLKNVFVLKKKHIETE